MFYEVSDGHPFRHDPFKAIIAPRPIGWISTVDGEGRANLAPYSFFNAFADDPPIIGFSSDGFKHSAANATATGEFVFNLATIPLANEMNASSALLPAGDSEFEYAGLQSAPSRLVRPPRVALTPAALECKVIHSMEIADLDGEPTGRHLVLGQVIAVHIDDSYLTDGMFDAVKAQSIARCGYRDYAQVQSMFQMSRPR